MSIPTDHFEDRAPGMWAILWRDTDYEQWTALPERFASKEEAKDAASTNMLCPSQTYSTKIVQMRMAQVDCRRGIKTSLSTVLDYLPQPGNYTAWADLEVPGIYYIEGWDTSGWTLDGYVMPRLASGMICVTEMLPTEDPNCPEDECKCMIQPDRLRELVSAARMLPCSTADASTDEEEDDIARFLNALALFDDLEV